ncbi:MgtC/SapB family protein [Paenibacillus senegalensis]|uniref:MgtC/SapB family protein n=1 Tax=Paenibacillus senegalensis TaxID=1465766 RepID=UPI000288BE75|nr:MgtC/SapB family protein [Paenibacillus senegalensis]
MDPWYIHPLDLTIRLVLALILGGFIGLEREKNNHPAGLRTHILVCVGSALLMLLSIYGFAEFANEFNVRIDPARLAAQVIPGIGFLGAGTIIRTGLSIKGLTTAASLWVAAAIGLAVGAGFYYAAFLATAFVLLSLWILNIVEKKYFTDKRTYWLKLTTTQKEGTLTQISSYLETKGVLVRKMKMEDVDPQHPEKLQLSIMIIVNKPKLLAVMTDDLKAISGVQKISLESA